MKRLFTVLHICLICMVSYAEVENAFAAYVPFLDSVVTETSRGTGTKYAYTYDYRNNPIERISYQKVSGGTWQNSTKNVYSYNTNDSIVSISTYDWESDAWANSLKIENTYDEAGHKTSYFMQKWEQGEWVNSIKNHMTYNEQGLCVLTVRYSWTFDQWEIFAQEETTYDEQGHPTEFRYYSQGGGNLALLYRILYTFDANGNCTLSNMQYWQYNYNTWREAKKNEYSYDTDGNLLTDTYYGWSESANNWSKLSMEEYAYDTDGKQIMSLTIKWNSGEAHYDSKIEFMYDENGLNSITTVYSWNSQTSSWDWRNTSYYYYRSGEMDIASPSVFPSGTIKLLHKENVYILRGDKTYTITGQAVK